MRRSDGEERQIYLLPECRAVMRGARALHPVTGGLAGGLNIVACALDQDQQVKLANALRDRAPLKRVETFRDLRDWLRETTAGVDIVIVPAREAGGESARRIVRELADERPRTAIIVYCHAGWQHEIDVRTLAVNGAHQFVFAGMNDDALAFRAVIESARRQCAVECVMQLLAPTVPPSLHPMVEAALARPDAITEVGTLAATLGVHRKTLFNMCKRAAFLTPAELLTWVRLVLVGYLLETTGCTVERIAIDLSYPSPTALRNTFRRHVAQSPSQVRDSGGAQSVVDALHRRLSASSRDGGSLHMV